MKLIFLIFFLYFTKTFCFLEQIIEFFENPKNETYSERILKILSSSNNIIFSGSSGSSNINQNNIKPIWEKKKEEIMNLPIIYMILGTQPVSFSNNIIHSVSNLFSFARYYLPESIASKKFVHSSLFIALEKKNESNDDLGALLEYGNYNEKISSNRTDYIGKSGLRYSLVSRKLFEDYINEQNENTLFVEYQLLECDVHSRNSMKTVLQKIVKNKNENEDISSLEKSFDAKNYNLLNNNCQTFVADFIEKSFSLLKNYDSYDYSYLKMQIPTVIVDTLEKIKDLYKKNRKKFYEDNLQRKTKVKRDL